MSSIDFFGDELGDALDERGLVDLVGNLGDDDGLASAGNILEAHISRACMKRPRPVL